VTGIDFYTLNIVTIANVLLAAIAILLVSLLNTGSHGLKRCMLACVLMVATFALYPIRTRVPGNTMIVLTNLPLFAAAMLLLDGIRAFRGFDRLVWVYGVLTVTYLAFFCWYLFIKDDVAARVLINGLAVGGVAVLVAFAMGVNVAHADRPVYWATAAGFAVHGIALMVRGVAALWGPTPVFYHPTAIDVLNVATMNLSTLGCAFGLAMATNLQLQRRTEKLALYDSLTNLPNRRFFEERLEQADRRAMESGERIALLYCDLDDFKGINDTLGHEGGDYALRTVAERLRSILSVDVCLARMGGDEFVALVENAPSRESMYAMMERMLNGVDGEIWIGGKPVQLRISCGMAIFPEDVGNTSDLLRLADAGMYSMKQRGRYSPVPQVG
jgi:diguanylate cyclase (GGDEF)-like protein